MKKKFWTVKTWYELLRLIGYGTIGAAGVYLGDQRLSAKEDIIKAKEAQIAYLSSQQPTSVNTTFEAMKKYYQNEIDMYKLIIEKLESRSGNAKQIEIYKEKIIDLETKLNLITQISDDVTKKMIANFGPNLKFDEIKPFAFFALFDRRDSSENSFKAFYQELHYQFIIDNGPILKIPPTTVKDFPGQFVKTGTHSPLYYSFDNVDLKTATFKKTDLRGVDLSDVITDENTRFPAKR